MAQDFRNRRIPRRVFLRGAGGTLVSLPWLSAMTPAIGTAAASRPPKRFLAVCATLGFHGPNLFPKAEGADYELTPYLACLAEHRQKLTLLSGLSHPDQKGNNGHASELTWLTSAQRPGLAGFKNTISIDQVIARHIGLETRYPYLALSTSGRSLSWSSAGVEIPAQASPAKLFKALFVNGSKAEVADESRELERGRSILDTVLGQANALHRRLGGADRGKLDEYLTSVRELESRLEQSQAWIQRDKPEVDAEPPQDIADKTEAIARQELMFDLIALALQTDSTRTITYQLGGLNAVPKIPGVSSDWHNLSHHGKDPSKIEELTKIEAAEFDAFGRFLAKLDAIGEDERSLLDSTCVLYGSNLGNASSHDARNLPLLVAGGGFHHGGYAAHDAQHNTPMANLLVQIARQVGVPLELFGTSTATHVRGLEA